MKDITFVDENDNVLGHGTKQEVWEKGIIHRIARVFLFNPRGELLIQKRADHIQSLPGRWDQSAAGHVDAGEDYHTAAERELLEEVGVRGVTLTELGKIYSDETDEPEKMKKRFSTIFTGSHDGEITPNAEEVSEARWIAPEELREWMDTRPNDFTQGFVNSFKYLQSISR
ncbi:MAG TPA: NUDIX domain-containing protein [Candidatus Paceibacterota bacterium]|jgi:16S rRNA (adenine1518-N6/adenine1519-N6)-dimethyltransferase